jgi:hypothetical protein
MTNAKARVSTLNIAGRTLDCLMMPDGSFRIAASQLEFIIPDVVSQNHATRWLKSALGKDSSFAMCTEKVASELNSNPVRVLTIAEFEQVLLQLVIAGNATAIEMSKALIGASLISLASSAFGVKFAQDELVEYVKQRYVHQKAFHPNLTAWLKLDGVAKTYGTHVNQFKLAVGLPLKPVQEYDSDELQLLNTKEAIYGAFRKAGFDHTSAISHL